MIGKRHQVYPIKQNQETHSLKKHQQTFDYLCEMRLVIGNKFASLY